MNDYFYSLGMLLQKTAAEHAHDAQLMLTEDGRRDEERKAWAALNACAYLTHEENA